MRCCVYGLYIILGIMAFLCALDQKSLVFVGGLEPTAVHSKYLRSWSCSFFG